MATTDLPSPASTVCCGDDPAPPLTRGGRVSTQHTYTVDVSWTGNHGSGTSDYRSYGREHEVAAQGCPAIPGTADPAFRGDPTRWNPEQLLLAALSQCHMLSYLYLCSTNGVVVVSYQDRPVGTMIENTEGDTSPLSSCSRESRSPTPRWWSGRWHRIPTPTGSALSPTPSTSRCCTIRWCRHSRCRASWAPPGERCSPASPGWPRGRRG